MTEDRQPEGDETIDRPDEAAARSIGDIRRFPGMAAIGLYMLLLAGTVVLGVVTKHFSPLYLIFPVFFIAGGLGLLLMFRWAWALALGAVGMLMGAFLYQFAREHAGFALVQGLLNLVFFFYLVRAEIRDSLR